MYDPNFKKEIDEYLHKEIVWSEFIDIYRHTDIYGKEEILKYLQSILDDELCKGSLDF